MCTVSDCGRWNFRGLCIVALSVASYVALTEAQAQSPSANTPTTIPEINVTVAPRTPPSSAPIPIRPSSAASELSVTGDTMVAVPASRTGEFLETAPGLVVTQHSGEGKANQYFLRGFNLDHGTDLAITIDGMPVNMRTHGHGQGYSDVNFLIPELISVMRIRKGPYYADEGDFSSAGALRIDLLDRLDKHYAALTAGSLGYWRGLALNSIRVGAGNLISGLEVNTYNGPWVIPDNVRKFNGLLRYSQGTYEDGFSLTAMGYSNNWTSTDQVAQRAIDSGLISRFGSLDPTDGGKSERLSLSGRWSRSDAASATRVEAYAIHSTLVLFNDFTYFLEDPVNGDQFSQTDRRNLYGINASHTLKGRIAGRPSETTFGIQSRYDDVRVGLVKTADHITLSTVSDDRVRESSVGLYAQNTTRWTDWFRSIIGIRNDWYSAQVNSDTPQNSGTINASVASPKFGMVFGPFAKTELFLNAGYGFHSNDARGSTITVDPNDKVTPVPKTPLLVRSKGAEVGVRTQAIRGLDSSIALFVLDFDSELLFVGDAGTTEPSRPSRRVGVEWTNHYKANSWLTFDLDFAYTRAHFTNNDPVGNYIPGSPTSVGSLAILLGEDKGWYGAVKLRYFGIRPLIEDNSVRAGASTLLNARAGYKFNNGVQVQLDAFNILNAHPNQIEYFYESQLRGEPTGVFDRHIHPAEPLAVRLTVAAQY